MRFTIVSVAIIILIVCFCSFGGCSRNVDEVKLHAEATFDQLGFEIVGYEGYELRPIFGGMVWYTIIKKDRDKKIIYQASIIKWFDEYHVYNLQAVDAIKP